MRNYMLAVVVALMVAPSAGFGESLGEAAKKEKERREKNKEAGVRPVRTITQDDVRTSESTAETGASYAARPSPPSGEKACCGDEASSSLDSSRSRTSDEERAWRSRGMRARERVDAARKRLAETPARITRHSRSGTYQGFITEDNPSYKSAEESLKRAEKELNDLEDEARREGILPGWLR